jgi:CDP-diacylglycerol--serine O-phosphatidyltransferase
VIVPALLMVSTLRFRSFKSIDIGIRRRYQSLIVMASGLALLIAYPQIVLLVMAYTYLASGFVGLAIHKLRGRDHEITPPPEPSEV